MEIDVDGKIVEIVVRLDDERRVARESASDREGVARRKPSGRFDPTGALPAGVRDVDAATFEHRYVVDPLGDVLGGGSGITPSGGEQSRVQVDDLRRVRVGDHSLGVAVGYLVEQRPLPLRGRVHREAR